MPDAIARNGIKYMSLRYCSVLFFIFVSALRPGESVIDGWILYRHCSNPLIPLLKGQGSNYLKINVDLLAV